MAGQVHPCHSPCARWFLGAEEDAEHEAPDHLLHLVLAGLSLLPSVGHEPWLLESKRK